MVHIIYLVNIMGSHSQSLLWLGSNDIDEVHENYMNQGFFINIGLIVA